jgi:cytochrome c2
VLGRKVASHEGYRYSGAEGGRRDVGLRKINHMIRNPGAYVPGTKMALFPGHDAKQRADVLVFLRQNDNPPPLPSQARGDAERRNDTRGKPGGGGRRCSLSQLIAKADETGRSTGVCKMCHKFDKAAAR